MTDSPIVYTPIYNDLDAYKANLKASVGLSLKRFVIDGRFIGFKQINGSDFSTDGTKEFCKENDIGYYCMAPCYEQDKLNFAFQIATHLGHKNMILLGADESLRFTKRSYGDLRKCIVDAQYPMVLKCKIVEKVPDHKYVQNVPFLPKLFVNASKLEAKNTHWSVYVKGTTKLVVMYHVLISEFAIFHDNKTRPKQRDDLMTAYQDDNIKRESKFLRIVDRDRHYGS